MRVYNILSKEEAMLINGNNDAWNHAVTFQYMLSNCQCIFLYKLIK